MTRVGTSPAVYFDPSLQVRLAEQVHAGRGVYEQDAIQRAVEQEEKEPLVQALMQRLRLLGEKSGLTLTSEVSLYAEGLRALNGKAVSPAFVVSERAMIRRSIRYAAVDVPFRLGRPPASSGESSALRKLSMRSECADRERPAKVMPFSVPEGDPLAPYEKCLLRAVRR